MGVCEGEKGRERKKVGTRVKAVIWRQTGDDERGSGNEAVENGLGNDVREEARPHQAFRGRVRSVCVSVCECV